MLRARNPRNIRHDHDASSSKEGSRALCPRSRSRHPPKKKHAVHEFPCDDAIHNCNAQNHINEEPRGESSTGIFWGIGGCVGILINLFHAGPDYGAPDDNHPECSTSKRYFSSNLISCRINRSRYSSSNDHHTMMLFLASDIGRDVRCVRFADSESRETSLPVKFH